MLAKRTLRWGQVPISVIYMELYVTLLPMVTLLGVSGKALGKCLFLPDNAQKNNHSYKQAARDSELGVRIAVTLPWQKKRGCLLSLAERKACFHARQNWRTPLKAPRHIPCSSLQNTK